MKLLAAVAMAGVFAAAAQAQTAPDQIEQVIVTAPRILATPDAAAHDFIRSFTVPSVLLGKISRWQAGICPQTRGLPPDLNSFMDRRLREIAAQVGAPVKAQGCRPNLYITFTPEPQKLLDNIRAQDSATLGYQSATTISHPVQAWYDTGIEDIKGQVTEDREGFTSFDNSFAFNPRKFVYNSSTPVAEVEGLPGRNGLKSELLSVTVIVDTHQTGSLKVDAVADYIAMLALTRSEAYDACQNVPSIANLLSPGCGDQLKPQAITASDIAFLRGVYRMDAGASLQVQQNDIAGEMATALAGR